MIAWSIGIICALTALSLALLFVIDLPSDARPVRIYEVARLFQGRPLASAPGKLVYSRQKTPPAGSNTELERVLASQLAMRLGKPEADVRVKLWRQFVPTESIRREIALYGPDGAADPIVRSTFSVALRDGDTWRVITRPTGDMAWRPSLWYSVALGLLVILPLTFWFSARIARPIRALAASAQNMRGSQAAPPIDPSGPSEIRMAAQSLNEMQARISRFVQERTTLTGAIAHDLRAPLTRLHFHLASAPAPVRDAAEAETQEMERMIQGILEFVEHEMRSPTREPIDLLMMIEGVTDDFIDLGKDVTVDVSEPITVIGDPLLLKRMFVNLVENAIKYGQSAKIELFRDGPNAIVNVCDAGNGMSQVELERAFDPFFRGEPSRNRNTGGVGLGLSVVKSAVDAHDGAVELANGEHGGLTAKIVLPIGNME